VRNFLIANGQLYKDTVNWNNRVRDFWQPGGFSESETPDPIPNSDVKPLSAYDTAS
mgnify:CR=1